MTKMAIFGDLGKKEPFWSKVGFGWNLGPFQVGQGQNSDFSLSRNWAILLQFGRYSGPR